MIATVVSAPAVVVCIALALSGQTVLADSNTLINAGFETGDLTGWSTVTNCSSSEPFQVIVTDSYTNASGASYEAPADNNFGLVPSGCPTNVLYQEFEAQAGETIVGWSFFSAGDYLPFDDSGSVRIGGGSESVTLFSSSVTDVGDGGHTPWVPWSYTFPEDGTYTLMVRSNNVGDFNSAWLSHIGIDIARTGGFVTGGGWFDSPAGAYKADTGLTGKANFQLESKYKKGANVPTGNLALKFKSGNLNFRSNSFDWMIVTDQNTIAQLKGIGSVNGAGMFGFILWVSDVAEFEDVFRIRIWDMVEGDAIVYDNDESAIAGGNITIHK